MSDSALLVDVTGRTFDLADNDTLHAVGRLRFALPAHSFTCIVGPSGCGKTTLLRMILGLDSGFDGSIEHSGKGSVAAVFQEPRLLPWRTVEQNVRLVLPDDRREETLDELFDVLGLQDMRAFYPNQLSLGLARRAALARAFILQPQLLILDEPFVSLDNATADRLQQLLLTLWHSHPTTALMVTHDIREAAILADRVLVFSNRPAHIIDEITIDTAQHQRDESMLGQIVQRIAQVVKSG